MNEPDAFNHDDLLDRAVRALGETPMPEAPAQEVVQQLLAALEAEADDPKPPPLKRRIFTMKSIMRMAAAASVFLALGLGIFWMLSQSGPKLAFADAADAFLNIRTATCRLRGQSKMKMDLPWGEQKMTITSTGKMMFRAPAAQRAEMESTIVSSPPSPEFNKIFKAGKPPEKRKDSTIQIIDAAKGEWLTLQPKQKMATLVRMANMSEEAKRQGDWYFNMRKIIDEARSGKKGCKVEPLGEKTIDGRTAVGYSLRHEVWGTKADYWVDPKTALPVRIELATTMGGAWEMSMVMDQFRTGMDLDQSLFSLEAPKGYKTHEMKLDTSEATIADLGKMLRVLAGRNNNVFPDELPATKDCLKLIMKESAKDTMWRSFMAAARAAMKRAKGEPWQSEKPKEMTPAEIQAMVDRQQTISRGFLFLGSALAPTNDWHYAGKGVKLDTPEVPIFWYKPTGSKTYQVLYADLSVKELAKDQLPEAEPRP